MWLLWDLNQILFGSSDWDESGWSWGSGKIKVLNKLILFNYFIAHFLKDMSYCFKFRPSNPKIKLFENYPKITIDLLMNFLLK